MRDALTLSGSAMIASTAWNCSGVIGSGVGTVGRPLHVACWVQALPCAILLFYAADNSGNGFSFVRNDSKRDS